jgi:2-dehydropantoate 2-reductase
MRLVIFGAGGVGSLFGAFLARAGHDVLLVGRKEHVQWIERDGLRVEGVTNMTVRPRVASALRAGERATMVILTVKTYDTENACRTIARAMSSRPILSLQNGLGNLEAMERGLSAGGWTTPRLNVALGVLSWGVTFQGPGHILHAGTGSLVLGDLSGGRAAKRFASLFEGVGIPTQYTDDIVRAIWRKVIINAAANPVTADHRVINEELLNEPLRGQAIALMREALEVSAAEGYPFPEHEIEEELFRVLRQTAQNRSSMLQDVLRGRPTEIEAISGAILERGQRHGLKLPYTERIYRRLKAKQPPTVPSAGKA